LQKAELNLLSHFEQGYGDCHEKQQDVFRNAFDLRCRHLGISVSAEFEPFWKFGDPKFDAKFQHALDPKHSGSKYSFADLAFDSVRNSGHAFG
jgi:hypothetical protein